MCYSMQQLKPTCHRSFGWSSLFSFAMWDKVTGFENEEQSGAWRPSRLCVFYWMVDKVFLYSFLFFTALSWLDVWSVKGRERVWSSRPPEAGPGDGEDGKKKQQQRKVGLDWAEDWGREATYVGFD